MATELIVHAYEWTVEDNFIEDDHTAIYAWCLNRNSESNLIRIHDFPVFCHVELPAYVNRKQQRWDKTTSMYVFEWLKRVLKEDGPEKALFKVTPKLYYYRGGKKYPMLILMFPTQKAMQKCETFLQKPHNIEPFGLMPLKVWETQIPLVRKLLTLRECKYAQWFSISGKLVAPEDRISTLDNEYIVSWRTMKAIPPEETKSWITHPKILSFDIESYSDNHRAMPNANASRHVAYMISCILQRVGLRETRKRVCVVLGDCNDIEYSNIVNSYQTVEIIDKIKATIKKIPEEAIKITNIDKLIKEIGKNIKTEGYMQKGFNFGEMILEIINDSQHLEINNRLVMEQSVLTNAKELKILSKKKGFYLEILSILTLLVTNITESMKKDLFRLLNEMTYKKVSYENNEDVVCMLIKFINDCGLKCDEKKVKEIIESKNPEIIRVSTELELCNELTKMICEYDPEIITGYNIFSFDYPYLDARLKRRLNDWQPAGRLIGNKTWLRSKTWQSSAYGHQDLNILQMDGRISIDMLPIIKRDHKLPKYTLEAVGQHFLGRGKHDVEPAEMFCIYEQLQKSMKDKVKDPAEYHDAVTEMTRVTRYCIEDSELTLDLFERTNTWIGLVELSNVVGVTIMELFTRGQQVRCLSLIYDLAARLGYVLDKRATSLTSFVGGAVQDPEPGVHEGAVCLDFKSLYPSIIRAFNICYTTLVPPELENAIPDEECHVIEWDEEDDDDSDDEEEEGEKPKRAKKKKAGEEEGTPAKKKEPKHYRFKFMKAPVGILPQLAEKLITERRNVNNAIKTEKDELSKVVLDRRQWALKITANSIFGFLGAAQKGRLPLPEAASVITAKGRELITYCKDHLVNTHGSRIIYGDSVTGDTPLLIREAETIRWTTIAELSQRFIPNDDPNKVRADVANLEIWSDQGWTKICQVIRHKTTKRLYRVLTHTGVVDVTEDHSLLKPNGEEVTPKEVKVGQELLHSKLPVLPEDGSFQEEIAFIKSACNEKGVITNRDKKITAMLFHLAQSVGYNVEIDQSGDLYTLTLDKQSENPNKIKKIIDLGLVDTYVYDLETENHHFAAGIGNLIVHNTDSLMFKAPVEQSKREAIDWGKKMEHEINTLFGDSPLQVELEKVGMIFSLKKKKYAFWPLDFKSAEYKLKDDGEADLLTRGIILARRDNCQWQRRIYNKVLLNIMNRKPMMDTLNLILNECSQLLQGLVPWRDLLIIRELGSNYKSPSYFMKIFSDELRRIGKPANPGDRLDYLIVKSNDPAASQLLGYKMRMPDTYLEGLASDTPEHIDYEYYLEKIVMNCVEQLYQIGYNNELAEFKNYYLKNDYENVFSAMASMGYGQYLEEVKVALKEQTPTLTDDTIYPELLKYILTTKLKTRVAKLKSRFLLRRNQLLMRINDKPIKALVKLVVQRRKALTQISAGQVKLRNIYTVPFQEVLKEIKAGKFKLRSI